MNASELRCGESHEFAKTWARAGGELTDISSMTQSVEKCRMVVAFLRGEAEIVVKTAGKAAETVIQKTMDLLRLVKVVAITATAEKKVGESFIGSRYYYRDANLNNWLPKVSPTGTEGDLATYQFEKELTFKEVAQAILGVDETSLGDLSKGLIAGGHTVSLSQIETLIERTDMGEDTGLRTDGWANFFFVQNKNGGVSIVRVDRYDGRQWHVYVCHLDNGNRWSVECRFFSRN